MKPAYCMSKKSCPFSYCAYIHSIRCQLLARRIVKSKYTVHYEYFDKRIQIKQVFQYGLHREIQVILQIVT